MGGGELHQDNGAPGGGGARSSSGHMFGLVFQVGGVAIGHRVRIDIQVAPRGGDTDDGFPIRWRMV